MGSRASISFSNSGGGSLSSCRVSPPLPSGLTASLTSGNGSCQITGTPSSALNQTTYRITATNATGADTTPATVTITVRVQTTVAPTTTATATNVQSNSASIRVVSSTTGTAYVVFLADGEARPSAATIKNARVGSNGVATAGSMAVTAGATATISQSGLTAGRAYDAYIVIESSNGTFSQVMKIEVLTPPATTPPPSLAHPNLVNASAPSFTVGVRINPIIFVNNGGGSLTSCRVSTSLPGGLTVSITNDGNSCRITGTPLIDTEQTRYEVTATNATGTDVETASISISIRLRVADADGNGLIEVYSLEELNNIRFDLAGTSYRPGYGSTPSTIGCPDGRCNGYELMNDLSFDKDGDGRTWMMDQGGNLLLDSDDNHPEYFDTDEGGWVPIGSSLNNPFRAIFDGRGHTIFGLAIIRNNSNIGMFGASGGNAVISNIGLIGSLVKITNSAQGSNVGSLVGLSHGTITAAYANGCVVEATDRVNGIGWASSVGGLVGSQSFGSIVASYAMCKVSGGFNLENISSVGGLVGRLDRGNIVTSFARGKVSGGEGKDRVGGLVGLASGSIASSYSSGRVEGGEGKDRVGGLVGHLIGSIIASFSTSDTDGGRGIYDYAGTLVGSQSAIHSSEISVIDSWGFGKLIGQESEGISGSESSDGISNLPSGVTSANDLTSTIAPDSWNDARKNTLGAWDLGGDNQFPTLKYADYDGSGSHFHCNNANDKPTGAIMIPNCDQRIPIVTVKNVLASSADINIVYDSGITVFAAVLDDGETAPKAIEIKSSIFGTGGFIATGSEILESGRAVISLSGLQEKSLYDVYIVVESSSGTLGNVMKVDFTTTAFVTATNVLGTTADINIASDIDGYAYFVAIADGTAIPDATAIKSARLGVGGVVATGRKSITIGTQESFNLSGLEGNSVYNIYVAIESSADTVIRKTGIDIYTMTIVDADGDGLIDINSLFELNNIRYNLEGSSYRTRVGSTYSIGGCPESGCYGYELTTDLDFDSNGDGKTWVQESNGEYTLDAGDSHPDYFDTNAGGWVPIRKFNAVFDGQGHTIANLAIVRGNNFQHIGLFGSTTVDSEIRNLTLERNLAKYTGTFSQSSIGGLVGELGGSVTASITNGKVEGSDSSAEHVGGLVGRSYGKTIASSASGYVIGGDGNDYVGGLIGFQSGTVSSSHAIGSVDGGEGNKDYVGGLVGYLNYGNVIASYAAGDVDGGDGDNDRVGGLLGYQRGDVVTSYSMSRVVGGDGNNDYVGGLIGYQTGTVIASYATGIVRGGKGHFDMVGGLVGYQKGGFTTASYASSNVDGGEGIRDYVGGLVGDRSGGGITASYASGDVDGGEGNFDHAGLLVGRQSIDLITASWGFGILRGFEVDGIAGSTSTDGNTDRPSEIISAEGLTINNTPSSWNEATSNTLDAWDFGTNSQLPVLRFADYDGVMIGSSGFHTGHRFHCENDADKAHESAIIIPNCVVANLLDTTVEINFISNNSGTAYFAALIGSSSQLSATAIKNAKSGVGGVVTAGKESVSTNTLATLYLTDLTENKVYDAYYVVESESGFFGRVMKVNFHTLRVADSDGNGLIEIGTLEELNNVRYNSIGTSYRPGLRSKPSTVGCPDGGCIGYELTADLNFDRDGDGSTWINNSNGSFSTLDVGDSHPDYFNTADGGWKPIYLDSIFDGLGHTISNLAIVRSDVSIGLFSGAGSNAEIRNLGVENYLAKFVSTRDYRIILSQMTSGYVGGLIGSSAKGSIITASYAIGRSVGGIGDDDRIGGLVGLSRGFIIASYSTGRVEGNVGIRDKVGGLVGVQADGSISASFSTAGVDGGAGNVDIVGGLVGLQEDGAEIIASYATGNVSGGRFSGLNTVGGLVGRQLDGGTITSSYAMGNTTDTSYQAGALVGNSGDRTVITSSWGYGSVPSGRIRGVDGTSDQPNGVTSATGLSSVNIPDSWNEAASSTLRVWDFGTASQIPALKYADYDGATVGVAPSYTRGHQYHCVSDISNAPDGAIIIPNCGMLIPGQVRTVSTSDSIDRTDEGSGSVRFILARSVPAKVNWIKANSNFALSDSANINPASFQVQWGSSGINDGMGVFDANRAGGDGMRAAWSSHTPITLKETSRSNLIATFDVATDCPARMRADSARYSLTGIFADPTLTNWNNFDGLTNAAIVGKASVSTWQIGTMVDAQATGSITIKNVVISKPYINFLMAGGGVDASIVTGTEINAAEKANVGVSIQATGTDIILASHSPNFCSDKYLKGDQHWAHFDVSFLVGTAVNIEIYDRDATSNCGFIAFDHFYQSDEFRGNLASKVVSPPQQ